MWPLEHNSEICFTGLNKKVFIFMSMEATSDSLPPKLTTKYTVSKVLKKGLAVISTVHYGDRLAQGYNQDQL